MFAGASAAFLGVAASAIGAGLVLGGGLLLQKLFPGDERQLVADGAVSTKRLADVNSDSNALGREGMLPIVINRRISPFDIVEPRIRTINGVEAVQRLFAFHGEHAITDIQADGITITVLR